MDTLRDVVCVEELDMISITVTLCSYVFMFIHCNCKAQSVLQPHYRLINSSNLNNGRLQSDGDAYNLLAYTILKKKIYIYIYIYI